MWKDVSEEIGDYFKMILFRLRRSVMVLILVLALYHSYGPIPDPTVIKILYINDVYSFLEWTSLGYRFLENKWWRQG